MISYDENEKFFVYKSLFNEELSNFVMRSIALLFVIAGTFYFILDGVRYSFQQVTHVVFLFMNLFSIVYLGVITINFLYWLITQKEVNIDLNSKILFVYHNSNSPNKKLKKEIPLSEFKSLKLHLSSKTKPNTIYLYRNNNSKMAIGSYTSKNFSHFNPQLFFDDLGLMQE